MTRSLPDSIYKKLTDEQKLLLGFCSIPPSDESNSIHTKKSYLDLKLALRIATIKFKALALNLTNVGPDGLEPSTHGLKVRCSTD